MAAAAILKIAFLAITHRPIVRFQLNFVWGSRTAKWQNLQIFKIRWRTAAISKIVKSPYLSQKSSDFDKIRYTVANVEPDSVHVTKNWIFLNVQKVMFNCIVHLTDKQLIVCNKFCYCSFINHKLNKIGKNNILIVLHLSQYCSIRKMSNIRLNSWYLGIEFPKLK